MSDYTETPSPNPFEKSEVTDDIPYFTGATCGDYVLATADKVDKRFDQAFPQDSTLDLTLSAVDSENFEAWLLRFCVAVETTHTEYIFSEDAMDYVSNFGNLHSKSKQLHQIIIQQWISIIQKRYWPPNLREPAVTKRPDHMLRFLYDNIVVRAEKTDIKAVFGPRGIMSLDPNKFFDDVRFKAEFDERVKSFRSVVNTSESLQAFLCRIVCSKVMSPSELGMLDRRLGLSSPKQWEEAVKQKIRSKAPVKTGPKVQQDAGQKKNSPQAGSKNAAMKKDWRPVKIKQEHVSAVTTAGDAEDGESSAFGLSVDTKVLLDSGATVHTWSNKNQIKNYVNEPIMLDVVGGTTMATGRGDVDILIDESRYITLTNVLHVPNSANLISWRALEKAGLIVRSNVGPDPVDVIDPKTQTVIMKFDRTDNFELRKPDPKIVAAFKASTAAASLKLWHERLGHVNCDYVKKAMANSGTQLSGTLEPCISCQMGKIHAQPSNQKVTRATKFLEKVHMDLAGGQDALPVGIDYIGPKRQLVKRFLIIVDDFSRYYWAFPIDKKTEVAGTVDTFLHFCKGHYNAVPKWIRSDGGREFDSKKFLDTIRKHGTDWDPVAAQKPQQNGMAERQIRTLIEQTRTLLLHSELPHRHWPQALQTAIYIQNRIPNSRVNTSPYQVATGKAPDLLFLRVFGSRCFVHEPSVDPKLEPNLRECALVGYYGSKCYKVIDIETGQMLRRADLTFREHEFPTWPAPKEDSLKAMAVAAGGIVPSPQELKEVMDTFVANSGRAGEVLLKEALAGQDAHFWLAAMREEEVRLLSYDVYDSVPKSSVPKDKKIIKGRWVLTRKADGSFRARWVLKGFQEPDVDDEDAYAGVIHANTMRILLAYTAHKGYAVIQADAVSAYLNADIGKELYAEAPTQLGSDANYVCRLKKALYGLRTSGRRWQEHLKAALTARGYAPLKADPNVYRKDEAFISVYVDDFKLIGPNEDDLHHTIEELNNDFRLKDMGKIRVYWGMSIAKDAHGNLNMSQTDKIRTVAAMYNLVGCRSAYVPVPDDSLLSELNDGKTRPDLDSSEHHKYRSAVGLLLHISVYTRPDIAYAVNRLAQKVQKPTEGHRIALTNLIRYLWTTKERQLTFFAQHDDSGLRLASDTSWARENDPHTLTREKHGNFIDMMALTVPKLLEKQGGC
ncbi:hypothetical protein BROUX41_006011 [Berkeleyomyces rouxiae]